MLANFGIEAVNYSGDVTTLKKTDDVVFKGAGETSYVADLAP